MPSISPVSDLRNYGTVLDRVKPGAPVYLTKNGRGEYSIHLLKDDEEFEEAKALIRMFTELNKGYQAGGEKGWLSDEDMEEFFKRQKKIMTKGDKKE